MIKKALAVVASLMIAVSTVSVGSFSASAVSGATGVGLAEHAMTAYYEDWSYVYGGSSAGAVDCSGLFITYMGVGGNRTNLLGSSSESGNVSDGIPRIHGLGLWQPGHVGIYVGSGMAVDARDEAQDMVYHDVSSKKWQKWFKVAGVNYPTTGWQTFEGNRYYYENGQYIVNCTRVIDGKTYTFNSDGVANGGQTASSADIAAAAQDKKEAAAAQAASEKKAAEEKAAAEEAASEQGTQLAQSLLLETVPLEEKTMPKVKAAVVAPEEQAVSVDPGLMGFVAVLAVFVISGVLFTVIRVKHLFHARGYVPAMDLAFVKQISRRMEKHLSRKTGSHKK